MDRDLEEEMLLHRRLRAERQMELGVGAREAERMANLRFGNVSRMREKSVMVWGSEWVEGLVQDSLYGAKALLRSRSLTIVALLSLALGIGANTAIFSLLDAVLLRSLPVHNPKELVLLGEGTASGIGEGFVNAELFSNPFFRQFRAKNEVFSDVAAIFSMLNDVHGYVAKPDGQLPRETELMHVATISGNYFSMLGVPAAIGRTIIEGDDTEVGDHAVAVVSEGFWKRSLASDENAVGRKIKLNKTIFTIVGVAPAGFFGTKSGEAPDLWVPLPMMTAMVPSWDFYKKDYTHSLNLIGRLKPESSLAQATANTNLLLDQITKGFPDADLSQRNLEDLKNTKVVLTPMANGLSTLRYEFSQPLKILMGVVALVLLIACANIANLLLARSTARARELAVRQALGAGRGRLVRQLLTESLILALAGGALGVGLAEVASQYLLRVVSNGQDTVPIEVGLNLRLLAFTFALTVGTAILFGTIPAFRATRLQLTETLKEGRGPVAAGSKNPLGRVLVVTQVALSLILMVGAGLFLKSLANLNAIDTGFNRDNVLRLQVEMDELGYNDEDPRANSVYKEIEARVGALPGVTADSFSSFVFREGSWSTGLVVDGMPDNYKITVIQNVVGNDYFKTMQIPLLAGRMFDARDTSTSQMVAVLSERVAKGMFPAGEVIGKHFKLGGDDKKDLQVIGIVKDVKFGSLTEKPRYLNYLSYAQRPWTFGDFEVRYTGDMGVVSKEVQDAIHSINRSIRITHVTTLDEQVARSITNQRLVAQLSAFFGLLAVFLSCIGIYGLMSYVVSRRTNEIGIRMALGAARTSITWMVMREIVLLVAVGIAIGVPVTVVGSKWVQAMLFGMKGTDVASVTSAILLLLVVGLLAGYLPARRAARVDPMVALRYE